jgi:uncharacterized protein YqeY
MRSGDALRRDVLRMTQNAVYTVEKRDRRELGDDDVTAILTREVKTRRESVEAFRKGAREDLTAKEEAEIAIMGWLAPRTRGRADGRRVSELVAQALAQADLVGHETGSHSAG